MFFIFHLPSLKEIEYYPVEWWPKDEKEGAIFLVTTDTFFFSLFLLFDSHTHKNKKKTIKIKQGDLSFSCLLVLYFSIPRCLLGFFFVFFQFSVGAPIHFCVCVCQKSYSFFFFLVSFLPFLSIRKQESNTFFDWFRRRKGSRHERSTLCDVSVCAASLLPYRSIAPPQRHTQREMTQGRSCLLSFLHFTWVLVMMMAISCTCHREKKKQQRQVGQFFFLFQNKCAPFSWLTSGGGCTMILNSDKKHAMKNPFFFFCFLCVFTLWLVQVFFSSGGMISCELNRSFVATQLLPIIAVIVVIISGDRRGGVDHRQQQQLTEETKKVLR